MAKTSDETYADLEACIQNNLTMAMLAAVTGNKDTAEHYRDQALEYMRQRRELRAADAADEQSEKGIEWEE